jgi:nitroreductase
VAITAKTAQGIDPDPSLYLGHIAQARGMTPDQEAAWRPRFKQFLIHKMGAYGDDAAMFGYTARQAYIALENMLLAAAMIQVDTCALEGLVHAEATAVLAEAGLIDPATDRFAVGAVFGYRSEDPAKPQSRRCLDEIVVYS